HDFVELSRFFCSRKDGIREGLSSVVESDARECGLDDGVASESRLLDKKVRVVEGSERDKLYKESHPKRCQLVPVMLSFSLRGGNIGMLLSVFSRTFITGPAVT
ncbi:unnamed protein product, partial [Strongylus vulgaris]